MVDRYRVSIVAPNYTPRGWFECDVIELSKAGYFTEYEVKFSVSDFRADAKKFERRYNYSTGVTTDRNKHAQLAVGDPKGPKRFWFVTPAGLTKATGVPNWAGLIEWRERPGRSSPRNVLFEVARPAPILHREKADEKIRPHLMSIFYYRFQSLYLFKNYDSTHSSAGDIGEPSGGSGDLPLAGHGEQGSRANALTA